jgi:hypothetical protein
MAGAQKSFCAGLAIVFVACLRAQNVVEDGYDGVTAPPVKMSSAQVEQILWRVPAYSSARGRKRNVAG